VTDALVSAPRSYPLGRGEVLADLVLGVLPGLLTMPVLACRMTFPAFSLITLNSARA
jgi:hypothetical protein